MPDESLHQPHDKLFRATFSDPVNAAAFLRHHLGEPLQPLVDWMSLSPVPGSFVNSEMEGLEADLLFSAKVGGSDALIYILWEHQHTEEPLMALRLLSYMVRIWNQQTPKPGISVKLTPILPLVLAQDKKRWKASTRFHELFAFPPEGAELLRGYTPDFGFRLLQLVDLAYEDIRGTPEGILTLRSLKAEPLGELLHDLVWERSVITGVHRETAERFFRYVLNANVDKAAFKAKVTEQRSVRLTKIAMTLAERFRQEGREEGEIHSMRRALLEVLNIRFGPVPEGLLDALSSVCDPDRLNAMHRSALTCTDLESFTKDL